MAAKRKIKGIMNKNQRKQLEQLDQEEMGSPPAPTPRKKDARKKSASRKRKRTGRYA